MSELTGEKLLIVWTSADRDVALNMVLMYTINGQRNRWWDQVTLLIWGPSQLLTLQDDEVREAVATAREVGVRLIACRSCADRYGVAQQLADLGIEVFGTGPMLTQWLQANGKVITL